MFKEHDNLCPHLEDAILLPILAGLPLYWRALQCVRRYHDKSEAKHLLNFGKYLASIMVVIAGALGANDAGIWALSIFSTVYSSYWDITMDFGLGPRELFGDRQQFFCRSTVPGHSVGSISSISHDPCMLGSHESTQKKRGRNLLFPRWSYWCAIVFDVVARSTWVLSLLPITMLTNNISAREGFKTVMMFVEILRRSIWAIFRIEHEQVSNASGYRALLWVPKKLGRVEHRFAIMDAPTTAGVA